MLPPSGCHSACSFVTLVFLVQADECAGQLALVRMSSALPRLTQPGAPQAPNCLLSACNCSDFIAVATMIKIALHMAGAALQMRMKSHQHRVCMLLPSWQLSSGIAHCCATTGDSLPSRAWLSSKVHKVMGLLGPNDCPTNLGCSSMSLALPTERQKPELRGVTTSAGGSYDFNGVCIVCSHHVHWLRSDLC